MNDNSSSVVFVLFGASGDLAFRKILPALNRLSREQLLPSSFHLLGVGRTPMDDAAFQERVRTAAGDVQSSHLIAHSHYLTADPADPAGYARLADRLAAFQRVGQPPPCLLFYLALPTSLLTSVVDGLTSAGLTRPPHSAAWCRIVLEKPLGHDGTSARALNRRLATVFPEEAVFRMDHYLGKETVQNILAVRFSNTLFEALWHRAHIRRVELTAAEDEGVGRRAGYYDQAGALRDMVQNHLLQILAFLAMEPPASNRDRAIRRETLKVLESLRPTPPDRVRSDVIRGQYGRATLNGRSVPGYREEPGVSPESRTETYVALRLFVDTPRWHGVPIVIRTGKRLPTRVTEAVIHFHPAPPLLFRRENGLPLPANQLILRIQPDEGLLLRFNLKTPGAGLKTQEAALEFHYRDLTDIRLPDAYERLLLDILQGDASLFPTAAETEAAWDFVDPILAAWEADPTIPLYGYPAGSWGPEAADALIGEPGEHWRYPCRRLSTDGQFCEL